MRIFRLAVGIAVAAIAIVPTAAWAQRRSASELQSGDEVRIKVRGLRHPVEGAVSENSREFISVLEELRAPPTVVQWSTVTRVQQSHGTSHATGLVTGLRRGAITGGIFGMMLTPFLLSGCRDTSHSTSCTEVVVGTLGVTTVFGGSVGSVLGFAMGARRWRDLSFAPR